MNRRDTRSQKTITQPIWAGGATVPAREVPEYFYTVYANDSLLNEKGDIEILKHENSSCSTKKEIKKMFNTFATKAEAMAAASKIITILKRGKLQRV